MDIEEKLIFYHFLYAIFVSKNITIVFLKKQKY